MNLFRRLISHEDSHNWIAIIISVIALLWSSGFSYFQNEQSYEHNKKSVTPIMNFYIFNSEESGYKIQNVGVGPAIIHGVRASNKNSNHQYDDWDDLVRNGLGYNGKYICSDTMKNTAQENGAERKLVIISESLKVQKSTPIKLELCYCSVYEDCWVSSTEEGNYRVDNCSSFTETLQC